MQAEFVTITPDIAREWLARLAPYQRRLNHIHVNRLANDMAAGRWQDNGSPIRFDDDARLCDGQHRLAACARAGVTLHNVLVVTGVSIEANATIDTNASGRSMLALARLRARDLPASVAASASCLSAVAFEHYDFENVAARDNCSPAERVELWERLDEHLQRALKQCETAARTTRTCSRAVLAGALRVLRSHYDPDFFCAALANAQDASPAGRVLYNALASKRALRRDPAGERAIAWMAMRAFVAHLRSEPLQMLHPVGVWPLEQRSVGAMLSLRRTDHHSNNRPRPS